MGEIFGHFATRSTVVYRRPALHFIYFYDSSRELNFGCSCRHCVFLAVYECKATIQRKLIPLHTQVPRVSLEGRWVSCDGGWRVVKCWSDEDGSTLISCLSVPRTNTETHTPTHTHTDKKQRQVLSRKRVSVCERQRICARLLFIVRWNTFLGPAKEINYPVYMVNSIGQRRFFFPQRGSEWDCLQGGSVEEGKEECIVCLYSTSACKQLY